MIPRLCGITAGGDDVVRRIRAALDAGLPAVLVREPALPDDLPDDPRIVLHARMPGAEALAARCGMGLHLSSAMSVGDFRRRFPGRLGASTHTPLEARAALAAGADQVFLSPVWKSASKPGDERRPLGLELLAEAAAMVPVLAVDGARGVRVGGVLALGGVTPERVRACLDAGAHGVAVMGGIFAAPDVRAAVREYLDAVYGAV